MSNILLDHDLLILGNMAHDSHMRAHLFCSRIASTAITNLANFFRFDIFVSDPLKIDLTVLHEPDFTKKKRLAEKRLHEKRGIKESCRCFGSASFLAVYYSTWDCLA
jgi:hypothetical protein